MRTRASSVLSAGALRLGAFVFLSFLMLGVALADDTDPSGRVARLSFLQGSVSLQPAGAQDWISAELNRPLTTNDRLWSDTPGSRAELDIGGAVIRVGSDTGFSFLTLDDNVAQMQLTAGTVSVTVRELLENQTYEIDTPNVAVLLDQAGQYRVDVNEAGNTTVVRVSAGEAEANGGGQTVPIANQQVMTFIGNEQAAAIPGMLGAPDGFDDWTFERDREYEQAASRRYVADDMAGTEDLDDNGQWQNTPDNGYVWIPTAVAAGWAPYSFGHWAWISPWGWTWVDNAPWGFAPFHYGRWGRWHNSWCWVPGPRDGRAMYSPAMVAWVGGGAGAAAGAGVGWFPLGPREIYVPAYRVSDRYVRTINVTNTPITDHTYISYVYQNRGANIHYANSAVPGAVTTVPSGVFASAQPVNAHRLNMPVGQEARFATAATPPAIVPIRQSVQGGVRGGGARRPPQALLNRVVVVRTAPPVTTGVRVRVVGRPAAAPMPSPPAPGDTRSWAERARALEHSTLPPAQSRDNPAQSRGNPTQAREYSDAASRLQQQAELQERSQERSNEPNRPSANGAAMPRDDRPSLSSQPARVEQERAPGNSYTRPQIESRPAPGPVGQQSPGTRFVAPPPPAPVSTWHAPAPPPAPVSSFPVPPPPPAPVPTPPSVHPGQPTPPANRPEQRSPSRAPARMDPPH
jgi:hypothetical protein